MRSRPRGPTATCSAGTPADPRPYGRNPYPGYDTPGERPFLYEGSLNGRVAPKERVVAVAEGEDAIAFPWSLLAETGHRHGDRAATGPSSCSGCPARYPRWMRR